MDELKLEHAKQDAMRREFTANVSHELKTPLTSISGYAEIIREGLARPEDISRFSGKIYDEAQRLITLVGDIIQLSQLEGKELQPQKVEIDLYETCLGRDLPPGARGRETGHPLHPPRDPRYLPGAGTDH